MVTFTPGLGLSQHMKVLPGFAQAVFQVLNVII